MKEINGECLNDYIVYVKFNSRGSTTKFNPNNIVYQSKLLIYFFFFFDLTSDFNEHNRFLRLRNKKIKLFKNLLYTYSFFLCVKSR